MVDKSFEIPESMRDVAEQGVSHSESVYDQLMEASRKVQEMMEQSSGAVFSSSKDIHQTALKYAKQNMQAGFTLTDKLLKAKDVKEALEIQGAFARDQMTAYSNQAQELSKLMSDAAKKSQQQALNYAEPNTRADFTATDSALLGAMDAISDSIEKHGDRWDSILDDIESDLATMSPPDNAPTPTTS